MESAMCYISMNSSQQALHANGKLFLISKSFFELTKKKIKIANSGVGY